MIATKAWLATTGVNKLGFDVFPPGYDPSWKIDLTGPYFRLFLADDFSGAISYGSGADEGVNGALTRRIPLPRHRRP